MAFTDPEAYRAYHRKWSAANKDKLREYRRNRLAKNPDYDKIQSKKNRTKNKAQRHAYRVQWRKDNPEKYRLEMLRQSRIKRGLPEPTRECPTNCELCGKPPKSKQLHLDHDHGTGEFRGWLCVNCNTAIGKLGDNVFGLQRAIMYLSRNELNNN
jgi:hypothetical protein